MQRQSARAGRYVNQPTGCRAFIPAPLPPDPPLTIDAAMWTALSAADLAVGRLDGVTHTLPNPDLFVAMYVRQEAVYSSQIAGTQSTLEDVLTYELDPADLGLPPDVEEVVNYVRAMNYGLCRLQTLPLSLRLIREIHGELLQGVRDAERAPGEFRRSQNWIGAGNAPLARATFVPPPPGELTQALGNLELFLNDEHDLPALVHAGLAHAQFETIHPFLDGNGRVGRLLITFLLVHCEVLHRPLLYLSHELKRRRTEYYDRLMAVRESGDWEGWLLFFLRCVRESAEDATTTARSILSLREAHRATLTANGLGDHGQRLLDMLFERPIVDTQLVSQRLGIAFNTASRLINNLVRLELLEETTGSARHRRYRYTPYVKLFEPRAPIMMDEETSQTIGGTAQG